MQASECVGSRSGITRHERELQVLASIAQLLAAQSERRQMIGSVLCELEKNLDMHRGTVMLLSSDGDELVVEAAHPLDSAHSGQLRYRLGEGVTGNVIKTGRPAIIPRVLKEPQFQNRIHRRHGSNDVSFLCVPIVLGSEVIGTLSVDVPAAEIDELREGSRFLSIVAA